MKNTPYLGKGLAEDAMQLIFGKVNLSCGCAAAGSFMRLSRINFNCVKEMYFLAAS